MDALDARVSSVVVKGVAVVGVDAPAPGLCEDAEEAVPVAQVAAAPEVVGVAVAVGDDELDAARPVPAVAPIVDTPLRSSLAKLSHSFI